MEVPNFDILIGQPIEKLLLDEMMLGKLDIKLGKEVFSIQIGISINSLIEPPLEPKSIEEVMAEFPQDSPESTLEKDAKHFTHEVDDSGGPLDPSEFEMTSQPSIELKPYLLDSTMLSYMVILSLLLS